MGTHTCPSCKCSPVVIPWDTPGEAAARAALYRVLAVVDALPGSVVERFGSPVGVAAMDALRADLAGVTA